MINQHKGFLFLMLFIEGGSLMGVELIGAKLLASFYGSSLFVWTAVLSITVLGLALGYYAGGKLSSKYASEKVLVFILGIAAIWIWFLPLIAKGLIMLTAAFQLVPGICFATLLLLVPPMFCFGLVGPFAVKLMTQYPQQKGDVSGIVYFTSTLGGVAATFIFGLYAIPFAGLIITSGIVAVLLISLPFIYLLRLTLPDKSLLTVSAKNFVPGEVEEYKKVRPSQHKNGNNKHRVSIYLYAVLEGGAVMAVELLAARMLAPYFGASLYVWSTVMGITLISLAIGYFAGGKVADRYMGIISIHWVLLVAAIFLVSMHFSALYLTIALQQWDLQMALPVVTFLLIFPPLVLLGMIPTLVIRYVSHHSEDAGQTTGYVFTLSSIAGIAALLLLGFWIIPTYGLTVPSIFTGVLVGMIPFTRLMLQQKYVSLLFVLFLLVSLSQRNRAIASPDLKILHFSEGILGQVIVADVYKNGKGEQRNDRMLFVNRIGQTQIDNNNGKSNWNYIAFASSVGSKLPEGSNALLLGLGGGSVANMMHYKLKFKVDAVELDERITKVARKYFALNPEVNVVTDDARHYLETTTRKYDLIFFDVFKGDVPPPHVLSVECFTKAKSLLAPNGFMVLNFNGFLQGNIGKPGRSVMHTLEASGFNVKVLATPGEEEKRNTLFVATLVPTSFAQVNAPLLFKGNPMNIDSLFIHPENIPNGDAEVLKDDKPSLEYLNIEASNVWRGGYTKTYTRFFLDNGIPLFD